MTSPHGMRDLPRPGIEPRSPALGAQSLTHWTAREVLGGGSLPAHLGSPRSWGPASHQHRHTGWVGSRSPRRRRAYRPLEGSRLRSRPGPESSAIPTPWVPRGPRLCWIHWETEVLFGPETLRSKDRSWRCWGAGCTVGEEARGRLLGAESDSRHIRMGWEWGNRET